MSGSCLKMIQNSQKFLVLWHRHTELTEVPSGFKTCCTRTPRIVAQAVQNSQKFRVRVRQCYKTSKKSGYGCKSLTELREVSCVVTRATELAQVPGVVVPAYKTHRSSKRVQTMLYTRTPGVVATGVQNFQNCRVRV